MISTLPLLVVSTETIQRAISRIEVCESCFPYAEYEFSYILDLARDVEPGQTEYFLVEPVYCPKCRCQITENTLVQAE